jgi:serine phosphatase RsbU (regulator of sigma subunit)
VQLELQPDDTLVLMTDGVLEARRNGDLFGLAGVERVLAQPVGSVDALATALEKAVLAFTGGSLGDDVAAVVVRAT